MTGKVAHTLGAGTILSEMVRIRQILRGQSSLFESLLQVQREILEELRKRPL